MIHSLTKQRKQNTHVEPKPGYLDPVHGVDLQPGTKCITRKMTPEDWAWLEAQHARDNMVPWATDKHALNIYLDRQKLRPQEE